MLYMKNIKKKDKKMEKIATKTALEEVAKSIIGVIPDVPSSEEISSYKSIRYSALVSLRDSGNLKPGTWYRITDYQTTSVKQDTLCAGHAFDILVLAISDSKLSEDAKVIEHDGETYFNENNLNAWKIKYCLDNSTSRFDWVSQYEGTGVIYDMIDEWGNEAPYDFKNIMFLQWVSYNDGDYDDDTWCYTFTKFNVEGYSVYDASVEANRGVGAVVNNKIGRYYYYEDDGMDPSKQSLTPTVFILIYDPENENQIKYTCVYNVVEKSSSTSLYGIHINYNRITNSSQIGIRGSNNIVENSRDCYIGENSSKNKICNSNTCSISNSCKNNTIENSKSCEISSGSSCNTIKEGTLINLFKKCMYVTVEHNNRITLSTTATQGAGDWIMHLIISKGINTSNQNVTINHDTFNDEFVTIYQNTNSQIVNI